MLPVVKHATMYFVYSLLKVGGNARNLHAGTCSCVKIRNVHDFSKANSYRTYGIESY